MNINVIKNYVKYSILQILMLIIFAKCDQINDDERFIPYGNQNFENTVLLEDFTGVFCSNCPRAAATASVLKSALGEHLTVVSIHAGTFATDSFRTAAGYAYQQYFYLQNNAYPAGMISRTKVNGNYINTNDAKWGNDILNRLKAKIPNIRITIEPDYNPTDSSFVVKSSILAKVKPKNPLKLQLWLVESEIVSFQVGQGNNYVHNHVLRDAINGIWGEDISVNINEASDYISEKYFLSKLKTNTSPKNSGKPENMVVVGFIYDSATMEVIDVKEIPLMING